jgi:hypothetical protein
MGEATDQPGVVDFADRVFIPLAGIGVFGLVLLFVRHALGGVRLPSLLYGSEIRGQLELENVCLQAHTFVGLQAHKEQV